MKSKKIKNVDLLHEKLQKLQEFDDKHKPKFYTPKYIPKNKKEIDFHGD